jgi:thiamine-phosphate pyrophosphorylase
VLDNQLRESLNCSFKVGKPDLDHASVGSVSVGRIAREGLSLVDHLFNHGVLSMYLSPLYSKLSSICPFYGVRSLSHSMRRQNVDLSLYLVTSRVGVRNDDDFIFRVISGVKGGVTCVQIRDHYQDICATIRTASKLRRLLLSFNVPLIINNRVDVALAVDADGVHLGQNDLPYKEARKILGPRAIIGLSVDKWADVEAAQSLDVDYLGVSQLFPSKETKPGCESPWGIEGLRKVRAFSRHRLVVIGGVTLPLLPTICKELNLGPSRDGVAMVGELWRSEDPSLVAQRVHAIFRALYPQQNKA